MDESSDELETCAELEFNELSKDVVEELPDKTVEDAVKEVDDSESAPVDD